MTATGRRQFCAALGAGVAGLSAVLVAGCSSSGGDSTEGGAAPTAPATGAALAGLAFEVRRDPG